MKVFFIFIIFFKLSNLLAQDTLFNLSDENGRQGYWKLNRIKLDGTSYLELTGAYVDNKYEGLWRRYYENGNIFTIGLYHNDTLDDEYQVYRPDGTLHYIESYSNGKLNGIKKWYDLNGVLSDEEYYKNNVRTGTWTNYFPDGNIHFTTEMFENQEIGPRKLYSANDPHTLLSEYIYENGEAVIMKYYNNGIYLADIDLKALNNRKKKKGKKKVVIQGD